MEKITKGLVIYATTSGNAELVAEAIASGIELSGECNVDLKRAELISPEIINYYEFYIMVSSTWNVGELEQRMLYIFRPQFMQYKFKNKPCGVVGLGDSKNYDIFCGAADELEKMVDSAESLQILPTLKIDGPPYANLAEYQKWGEKFFEKFKNLY